MSQPLARIMIGTPCYGGSVSDVYLQSVLRLQRHCLERGAECRVVTLSGESLITRGRNLLVSRFLDAAEWSHLMFIDADIGFESDAVSRMVEFDRDVVCGIYPLKGIDWSLVGRHAGLPPDEIESRSLRYVVSHGEPRNIKVVKGFAPAVYAPTGFMLIKRGVFERMKTAYPELKFRRSHFRAERANREDLPESDNQYAFFDCMIDPETGVYLSEDYTFCNRWRRIGGEIWVDMKSRLTHVGTYPFRGDYATQYTPAEPPGGSDRSGST
jgi:hypothetical protein